MRGCVAKDPFGCITGGAEAGKWERSCRATWSEEWVGHGHSNNAVMADDAAVQLRNWECRYNGYMLSSTCVCSFAGLLPTSGLSLTHVTYVPNWPCVLAVRRADCCRPLRVNMGHGQGRPLAACLLLRSPSCARRLARKNAAAAAAAAGARRGAKTKTTTTTISTTTTRTRTAFHAASLSSSPDRGMTWSVSDDNGLAVVVGGGQTRGETQQNASWRAVWGGRVALTRGGHWAVGGRWGQLAAPGQLFSE